MIRDIFQRKKKLHWNRKKLRHLITGCWDNVYWCESAFSAWNASFCEATSARERKRGNFKKKKKKREDNHQRAQLPLVKKAWDLFSHIYIYIIWYSRQMKRKFSPTLPPFFNHLIFLLLLRRRCETCAMGLSRLVNYLRKSGGHKTSEELLHTQVQRGFMDYCWDELRKGKRGGGYMWLCFYLWEEIRDHEGRYMYKYQWTCFMWSIYYNSSLMRILNFNRMKKTAVYIYIYVCCGRSVKNDMYHAWFEKDSIKVVMKMNYWKQILFWKFLG